MKKPIALDTPELFDAVVRSPRQEHLWGAKVIGAAAGGVSPETVRRTWARDPECPVRKRGGKLYAARTELEEWLGQRA